MIENPVTPTSDPMIWGSLLHLSYNMWSDRDAPEWRLEHVSARPYLRFDETLWNDLLSQMADAGMNMVVIDLGDGVHYKSHPEIAVEGAWTPGKLREELAKIRQLGLEPIPKLNFSTCHDAWLGPYSRCVSTDTYYDVCRDLIAEVIDLFDQPRFFHLGMDEETAEHQRYYALRGNSPVRSVVARPRVLCGAGGKGWRTSLGMVRLRLAPPRGLLCQYAPLDSAE